MNTSVTGFPRGQGSLNGQTQASLDDSPWLLDMPITQANALVKQQQTTKASAPSQKVVADEVLAEFKTTGAPKSIGAQILGTLRISGSTLGVSASISPCLARNASSQGAANWF